MLITRFSPISGNVNTMDLDVTQEQLDRHDAGEYAQNVFTNLTKGEREFIISGITESEWAEIFGEE